MMKSELEHLVGAIVTPKDYEIIELVYNYHPCNFSKHATASLYKEFGIIIFEDMKGRSEKVKEYELTIHQIENDLRILKEKMEKLKE